MLAYIPWFGWLGMISVLGFYTAAVIMMIAKKKRRPQLRKYHVLVAGISLMLATIHGLYALSLFF